MGKYQIPQKLICFSAAISLDMI